MEILDSDIHVYLAAVKLGTEAHATRRYGDSPYTVHLAHVENTLTRFGFTDPYLLAAAWLHDAVEDKTGVTLDDINIKAGLTVALLVEAVTDGEGQNREDRKVESYRRMRGRAEAIPLKLADRIANVEACYLTRSENNFHDTWRNEMFTQEELNLIAEALDRWIKSGEYETSQLFGENVFGAISQEELVRELAEKVAAAQKAGSQ
jgi:(p)ppGpp synthase/HD superfamily hydrolase